MEEWVTGWLVLWAWAALSTGASAASEKGFLGVERMGIAKLSLDWWDPFGAVLAFAIFFGIVGVVGVTIHFWCGAGEAKETSVGESSSQRVGGANRAAAHARHKSTDSATVVNTTAAAGKTSSAMSQDTQEQGRARKEVEVPVPPESDDGSDEVAQQPAQGRPDLQTQQPSNMDQVTGTRTSSKSPTTSASKENLLYRVGQGDSGRAMLSHEPKSQGSTPGPQSTTTPPPGSQMAPELAAIPMSPSEPSEGGQETTTTTTKSGLSTTTSKDLFSSTSGSKSGQGSLLLAPKAIYGRAPTDPGYDPLEAYITRISSSSTTGSTTLAAGSTQPGQRPGLGNDAIVRPETSSGYDADFVARLAAAEAGPPRGPSETSSGYDAGFVDRLGGADAPTLPSVRGPDETSSGYGAAFVARHHGPPSAGTQPSAMSDPSANTQPSGMITSLRGPLDDMTAPDDEPSSAGDSPPISPPSAQTDPLSYGGEPSSARTDPISYGEPSSARTDPLSYGGPSSTRTDPISSSGPPSARTDPLSYGEVPSDRTQAIGEPSSARTEPDSGPPSSPTQPLSWLPSAMTQPLSWLKSAMSPPISGPPSSTRAEPITEPPSAMTEPNEGPSSTRAEPIGGPPSAQTQSPISWLKSAISPPIGPPSAATQQSTRSLPSAPTQQSAMAQPTSPRSRSTSSTRTGSSSELTTNSTGSSEEQSTLGKENSKSERSGGGTTGEEGASVAAPSPAPEDAPAGPGEAPDAGSGGGGGGNALGVRMEPMQVSFVPSTAPGGPSYSHHKIFNGGKEKVAMKIKCSDNKVYRLRPVFSVLEAGKELSLTIARLPKPDKRDKLVAHLIAIKPEQTDAAQIWKERPSTLPSEAQIVLALSPLGLPLPKSGANKSQTGNTPPGSPSADAAPASSRAPASTITAWSNLSSKSIQK